MNITTTMRRPMTGVTFGHERTGVLPRHRREGATAPPLFISGSQIKQEDPPNLSI